MHRRLWLLAGAAAALLVLATSATATTKITGSASASRGTPAAMPFAQAFAHTPRTPAARKAKLTTIWAEEQDINGFNNNLNCCNQLSGGLIGNFEAIHGACNVNSKGTYFLDLAKSAAANATGIVYTDPARRELVRGRQEGAGHGCTTSSTRGSRTSIKRTTSSARPATTRWRASPPRGRRRSRQVEERPAARRPITRAALLGLAGLFGGLYPAFALKGLDFNKIWTNCICDANGEPVSNGPFYVTNTRRGRARPEEEPVLLQAGLNEVDFKIIADTNTEVQAMRGGEVDALIPTFGSQLAPLQSTPA